MARRVVGNPFENQLPTVAATARPVDTYVRAVVEKSPLEGLAKLLSNLEKKAVPALQREEERRANAEYAEGVELYNKNRIEMGQAVKDGLIDEGASPYLRKGYRISHLSAMGARYTNELSNALDNQELYKNGNPESISDFTNKFYTDFQENNGLDDYESLEVAEYFSGAASKANEAFRQSWTEKNVAWQKDQNYAAWTNEISTYADAMFLEDDTDVERAIKADGMAKWLNNKAKLAEIDGMDREKVNKTIIDAIVLSAYELNDPDVLDVLDKCCNRNR
jgi:DNA-binding phage protein